MVYQPGEVQGKEVPIFGPYRIVSLTPNCAEVILMDRPRDSSIFVALDRVRYCCPELGDTSWTGERKRRSNRVEKSLPAVNTQLQSRQGPMTHSRAHQQPEQ